MKKYLVTTIFAILLSSLMIIFSVLNFFPLGMIWGSVFLFSIFILILWRPRQFFWIFVVLLPLENVIFLSFGNLVSLRPFQIFGGLLILAVLIRMIFQKNDFTSLGLQGTFQGIKKLFAWKKKKDKLDKFFEKEEKKEAKKSHFNLLDLSIFTLPIFAFLSIVNSPGEMLFVKQALILTSFVFIYWLSRNYIQSRKEQLEAVWFFIAGSLPVIFYGVFQAIVFQSGWAELGVFSGRINATFTEPDWLGMYLVFLSAITFWLKFLLWESENKTMIANWSLKKVGNRILDFYLLLIFVALILTVARSAWLGFGFVVLVYFKILFFLSWQKKGQWAWNIFFKKPFTVIYQEFIYFLIVILVGLGLVYFFNLSSFHLANRAESSFSGMQKITVSCEENSAVPEKIKNIEELAEFNCKHINLEEIEKEKSAGFEIKEVYRPDPNVEIRKEVYLKTWSAIKNHWVIGQGIGSSGSILGPDENGTGLNASNIFLEIWISIGIFGLIVLVLVLFSPIIKASWEIACLFFKLKKQNWFNNSFIVLIFMALVIPNLFNAGWLLGFFWVALAIYIGSFKSE